MYCSDNMCHFIVGVMLERFLILYGMTFYTLAFINDTVQHPYIFCVIGRLRLLLLACLVLLEGSSKIEE